MYGLSQHYLNKIRNAFKRGELSHDEAMCNLAVHYSNNIVFDIMSNPCKHDFTMKCLKDAYNMRKREWNHVLNNSKL